MGQHEEGGFHGSRTGLGMKDITHMQCISVEHVLWIPFTIGEPFWIILF